MTINEKRMLGGYIRGLVRESVDEKITLNNLRSLTESMAHDAVVNILSEGAEDNFRGCDNIEMVWHGEWADPELKCNGYIANYYEIEDAVYEWAKEEGIDADNDDEFSQFCIENQAEIEDMIQEMGEKEEGFDDETDEDSDNDIAGINELRQLTESMARRSVNKLLMEKKKGAKAKKAKKDSEKKSSKKISSAEKTLMSRLNDDSINAAHYYYKLYGAKSDAEKAAARSLGYKKAKGEKTPNKKGHYRFSSKEKNKLNAMLTADNN